MSETITRFTREGVTWQRCNECGYEEALFDFMPPGVSGHKKHSKKFSAEPPIAGFQYLKLNDGTFLVGISNLDLDENHWHVAPDGTVLNVKVNGTSHIKRSDIRRTIGDVVPSMDSSFLWKDS